MIRTKKTQRGTAGFTMTEILTVVALMGVASAVAIPQFSSNTEQYAQTTARGISHDIQYAQDLAVTTQSPVTLSLESSGYEYSLKDSNGDVLTHPVSQKPYTVDLRDDPNISQLNIELDFAGATDVVFDPFGTPGTGGTITISHSSFPSDVVLTLHAATGSVTVTQTP